jgi:hypothetical protein
MMMMMSAPAGLLSGFQVSRTRIRTNFMIRLYEIDSVPMLYLMNAVLFDIISVPTKKLSKQCNA